METWAHKSQPSECSCAEMQSPEGSRGSQMAWPSLGRRQHGHRDQLAPPSAASLEMLFFICNKELHYSCSIHHPQLSTVVFTSSPPCWITRQSSKIPSNMSSLTLYSVVHIHKIYTLTTKSYPKFSLGITSQHILATLNLLLPSNDCSC